MINYKQMSLLVIDDDPTMRNALAAICRDDIGFGEVLEAENGLHGWRKLEERPFDIVLLDWMMPIMNGYNFVKIVRGNARRFRTKIIMITSKRTMNDLSSALAAGVTSYLIKPFEPDALVRKIEYVAASPHICPKQSEYLENAEKFLAAEEYGDALKSFSRALDVVPADSETKLKLVTTFIKKREYDKAYTALSEMLKNELSKETLRSSSAAMVKLGDIDFDEGRLNESADKYREAVTADPLQIEGYVGLGEVDLKRGNRESAMAHFNRAENLLLDVGEDDITILNNIAVRHRRSGRPEEAIRLLESSLKRAQNNPYLLYNLGRAYVDLEQFELAEACFRDAIKLAPDLTEAKMMLQVIGGK